MNGALHLPMPFAMDMRKPTGFRLDPERHARLTDEARHRGWSLQTFLDWCLDQALDLAFLTAENRTAVRSTLEDLKRHFPAMAWSPFDVINLALTQFFAEVRAGKLVLRLAFWQRDSQTKSGSPRDRAKRSETGWNAAPHHETPAFEKSK